MAIEKCLDLSTGHVKKETSSQLDNNSKYKKKFPFRVIKHEYGWIIPVSLDPESSLDDEDYSTTRSVPDELKSVYQYAKANGCYLINFDSDGPEIEDLPTFDW